MAVPSWDVNYSSTCRTLQSALSYPSSEPTGYAEAAGFRTYLVAPSPCIPSPSKFCSVHVQHVELHWHKEAHHAARRVPGQSVRGSAIRRGHLWTAVDTWIDLMALDDGFYGVSDCNSKSRTTYGKDDFGSLSVDDHDLSGHICMSEDPWCLRLRLE